MNALRSHSEESATLFSAKGTFIFFSPSQLTFFFKEKQLSHQTTIRFVCVREREREREKRTVRGEQSFFLRSVTKNLIRQIDKVTCIVVTMSTAYCTMITDDRFRLYQKSLLSIQELNQKRDLFVSRM